MRQKISLAAALLHDPQILFLDEPTVGLDPKSAHQMKDLLQDFCREGKTVFFSTHILEIAERMCTRMAIIDRGRLIAAGTLEELRGMAAASVTAAGLIPASPDGQSLEQVFLRLTGSEDDEDMGAILSELEG